MKVLLIDDDKNLRERIKRMISNRNTQIAEAASLTEAKNQLQQQPFDVVVCSVPILSYANPHQVLRQLQQVTRESCQLIFLTRHIKVAEIIELVKAGLSTCLARPEELFSYLEKLPEETTPTRNLPSNNVREKMYVRGVSVAANEMYKQINLVASTELSVIIYGETGTGKESIARRLAMSRSADAPYITLDCGCLSRELAASELFGCTKGAFTGAYEAKAGAFEEANGGTLFLDEIGNLDIEVQTYLLRALQERKIRRIGGQKETTVNVRVVVASNENLLEAVNRGQFREDLHHRLNEFEITIPPLRYRSEDIPIFVDSFLRDTNQQLKKNITGIQDEVMNLFLEYSWPGNIRELKNVIRRACLLNPDHQLLSLKSLPAELSFPDKHSGCAVSETEAADSLKSTSRKAELEHISAVLRQVNYNKTKAAEMLNIDRKTLYNKLKKFPISPALIQKL